jgi:hypothetical protein
MLLDLAFFGTPPCNDTSCQRWSDCDNGIGGHFMASSLAYDELKKNVWFFEIQKADI